MARGFSWVDMCLPGGGNFLLQYSLLLFRILLHLVRIANDDDDVWRKFLFIYLFIWHMVVNWNVRY